jgi:hypothetical protein
LAGDLDLPAEVEQVANLSIEIDHSRANLSIEIDHSRDLYDFYLLHNAYDDLRTSEVQWYWEGATRSNILQLMKSEAEKFARDTDDIR